MACTIRGVAAAALAVALGGGLATAGCDLNVGDGNFNVGLTSGRATDTWTRTYTLSEGGTIEVVNQNGPITVEPSTVGGQVEVRAERLARSSSDEAAKRASQEDRNPRRREQHARAHRDARPENLGPGRTRGEVLHQSPCRRLHRRAIDQRRTAADWAAERHRGHDDQWRREGGCALGASRGHDHQRRSGGRPHRGLAEGRPPRDNQWRHQPHPSQDRKRGPVGPGDERRNPTSTRIFHSRRSASAPVVMSRAS